MGIFDVEALVSSTMLRPSPLAVAERTIVVDSGGAGFAVVLSIQGIYLIELMGNFPWRALYEGT